LTQLALGLDRDSGLVANLVDERDPAVKMLLAMAISAANKLGKYIGICGQGPSDHPDLAEWLMDQGISSISLNPDTVVDTGPDPPGAYAFSRKRTAASGGWGAAKRKP
jgi:pyruvate,water dikinase